MQDTLFHPSSEHELTDLDTTVLHDLQTGLKYFDITLYQVTICVHLAALLIETCSIQLIVFIGTRSFNEFAFCSDKLVTASVTRFG